MLYLIPQIKENYRTSVFDVGRWAGEKFGYENIWRFRNGRRHLVSSDRMWRTVRYIEIDNPEDCIVFELVYGQGHRQG